MIPDPLYPFPTQPKPNGVAKTLSHLYPLINHHILKIGSDLARGRKGQLGTWKGELTEPPATVFYAYVNTADPL